jgi:hypothetical protein
METAADTGAPPGLALSHRVEEAIRAALGRILEVETHDLIIGRALNIAGLPTLPESGAPLRLLLAEPLLTALSPFVSTGTADSIAAEVALILSDLLTPSALERATLPVECPLERFERDTLRVPPHTLCELLQS